MVDGEEGDVVVVALSRGGVSCTSSFGMKTCKTNTYQKELLSLNRSLEYLELMVLICFLLFQVLRYLLS